MAARALTTVRSGFRRLSTFSAFSPPPPAQAPPKADPSTNLFVSGMRYDSLCFYVRFGKFGNRLEVVESFYGFLILTCLSKRTTTEGLREAFSKFGEVASAKVVTDRVSGYSKGFGFVRYATLDDAAKGIEGMDGKFLDGWVIFAEYARPRPLLPSATADTSSGYQTGYQNPPTY
ncbi:hypothetical protein J5N97_011713 [Dioscorea zingiberensis]|uniref:RRM domain-containing protein n=1 Tax=Dioscorea zingiberensis TaxID=325984 RepID=A0A9D5D1M8_9LILI|nr:hypothetical protein J5N97_011713 [Dioscorea zingiberensis]